MEPPKWIIRMINFYCPPQLAESVIGDIWEQYLKDETRFSKFKSNRRLLWNALRFFRPGILVRNSKTQLINTAMLRINLLLALRNMRKYKFYSLINILGLALSLMFGLLVFFYVQNAIQHDSFHAEHESIFRFTKQIRNRDTNELLSWNNTAGSQLATDLRNEIPSIERISRLISGSGYVKKGSETFSEKVMLVDSDFFDIFSFPIIEGDKKTPLTNISQVVLSPPMAEKYFGVADPIGKQLEITVGNDSYQFIVSAVADPIEELNSLPFDMIIHIDHLKNLIPDPSFLTGYDVSYLETYLKLNPQENVAELELLLTETFERLAQIPEEADKTVIKLQPISKLYWWSNEFAQDGEAITHNPDYVYILIGLSLLVIVIAVLNFIMLTSSQSLNRIKEFGIRKTMGAFKRQLASQLLLEVLILALAAGVIALVATYYFIPVFNSLANAKLNFHLSGELFGFILILISVISIISSLISSGVILRLKTTSALKGTLSVGGSSLTRNLMVVIQFTFCVGLIIGTIVFKNQMSYVSNKSLGFEKNQLVEVELPQNLDAKDAIVAYETLSNELKSNPIVVSTAATMTTMSVVRWTVFTFEQQDESKLKFNFNLVTSDYISTMGLELIAGRDFREDDTGKAIIVNESLVKEMGWKDPLGKQIPGKDFTKSHEIIGVVKDFNFNSLHSDVAPLILVTNIDYIMEGLTGISSYVWPPQLFTTVIKVAPGNAGRLADEIHAAWQKTMSDLPFEMKYVNDILNEKYKEEKRYSSMINYAAGFSLFIAWLGLLALTRLVIQKRFKEMGIRKVLGSSSLNIILLVARKFVLLIGLATLLASPIAWWLLKDWLSDFAYKVDLNPLIFLLSGLAVIGVTFISISIQSLRISNINPSEALRME
ncbi:ABC transporter permease [Ekhidna sp. To15]|uniref:ABC transporter permease n=1 Tax=Ekhidna sp. To15 TaxID=3395267 RepID=UPI003F520F31